MNKYTREEVFKVALDYFDGDELATNVWINKYALKDSDGNIYEQSPDDMHKRLAIEIARIEHKYVNPLTENEVYNLIKNFKYIVPQGGPMSGIGNNLQTVSLSNCFVIGNDSDSYGGLLLTDQQQVQLMKRRGGCIEENTNVYIKGKGVTKIKDVLVGDYILSLNDKTNTNEYKRITDKFLADVKLEEQVKIKYGNGTLLRTSSKHPVTTLNDSEIIYKSVEDGLDNKHVGVKPNNVDVDIFKYDDSLSEIAWFLGAHTGDGTCDYRDGKYRIRIVKDNKMVVGKYAEIANKLSNSNCNTQSNNDKRYNVDMWRYTQSNNSTQLIVDTYFDGKYGKKVYNGDVYSFITNNNLWIPYLAGIVDTDGTIKNSGTIEVSMCMNKTIDKLCTKLAANGIDLHCRIKDNVRCNESPIYKFNIYRRNDFVETLIKYINNDAKKQKLIDTKLDLDIKHNRYSRSFYLSDTEIEAIIDRYSKSTNKNNNLSAIISILKKKKRLGLGGLIELKSFGIISEHNYCDITKRINIDSVEYETSEKLIYYDINVEDNHNYFAGNYGLVNIHNCGHDLSQIRPKGSPVKNSALTSTGVVPFMERFSNSTREVAQDGRRGALMLSLSIKHPDAESFIDAKLEQGKITGANISVKIDDEFMNSVLNNTLYKQQYPIHSSTPNHSKDIDANKLWKKIIHNAWKSAEPGILFWDTIIRESLPDCYKEFGYGTVSTNPCQPKYAKVLTPNGIRTIGDVNVGDVIWSNDGWTNIVNKWSTGIKKVFKYETTFNTFYGTENHRVVSNGIKEEVKDAKFIDLLRGQHVGDVMHDNNIIMDGLVLGDGSVHEASNNLVYIYIGKNDTDYFNSEVKDLILKKRDDLKRDVAYEIKTNITFDELPLTFNRTIPNRYLFGDRNVVCSFLRGLYSANGSVVSNRVTLKSASKQLIEQVRLMLSSIGIASYITTNKPKKVKFENGEYQCKESYDLNITYDKLLFYNQIGFIQSYKNDKLLLTLKNKSCKKEVTYKKIVNRTYLNDEEVFDITVDNESHTYWTEGCNVSNCGEIPLSPYDSCRLLSLNLFSYVVNPFTKDAYFDFELFKTHAMYAQRMMDDIIDLEIEKIDQILDKIESDIEPDDIKRVEKDLWLNIKRMAIDGRRTGTGITAEGDMLAALGLTYGTKEATDFAVQVHKTLAAYAYKSSIIMAKERGSFKVWDSELENKNPFLNRIHSTLIEFGETDVIEQYEKTGRRNIALLTIPPAGTTSIMTQTTSGIEPVFLPVYNRRRKVNPNDKNVKISFTDENGDTFEEYNVFHPKFKMWAEINGYNVDELVVMKADELANVVEKSPYYKATSNDVNWVEKVRMQGNIQLFVDHSISVTTNLPNDVTEETVANVYEMGWKSGCKGMTVYRDGSRNGVLISTTKKDDDKSIKQIIKENNAPKRPKEVNCDVIRFVNGGEKWIGFIGLLGDKPYEIFTGLAESFDVPSYVEKGVIVRNKISDEKGDFVSRYDFVYKDKDGYKTTKEGMNRSFNPQYYNIAKMTSAVLRHGMPIPSAINLIDSLLFDGDLISTWKNGVKRMLKRYIVDGTTVNNKKCPTCGENSLVYEGGCVICKNCGESKCG